MSELKDKTIEKMAEYLYARTLKDVWEFSGEDTKKLIKESFKYFAQNMLQVIPELTIVDRNAKDVINEIIYCKNRLCECNDKNQCTDRPHCVDKNGVCEFWIAYKERLKEDKRLIENVLNPEQSEASKQLDAMHKDMASGNYLDQMEHNKEDNV
jgi:uncharacterized protein YnzC (UPF0291/DUF896 family)